MYEDSLSRAEAARSFWATFTLRSFGPRQVFNAGRFWAKVDKSDGCWTWRKPASNGYGVFFYVASDGHRRGVMAHRWAYEELVGPIPEGLHLDHLCRNPPCVRPDHLEPVTQKENILRGIGMGAMNAAKTHCMRGHPLSGDNLGVYLQGRQRRCLRCAAAWTWTKRHAHVVLDEETA